MVMSGLDVKQAELLEAKRRIPCEIASEAGVVSRADAIGWEYRDRGAVRFVKWRGKDKRFWIEPSGQKLQLWNIDALREGTPDLVIFTEGEFDALAWMTAGAPHVVSVPNGAPGTPGHGDINPSEDDAFAYLWNGSQLIPELLPAKKIVLSTDADGPGRILAEELAIRLGRERCWLVTYPEGCKDANDVLVKYGVDGVGDLLANAKPLVPNELVPVTDLPRNPLSVSHSTGWGEMDGAMMIVPPELIVLSGMPNAGKSQFAWALGANLARLHGWRGAVIQFEDGANRLQDSLLAYASAWKGSGRGCIGDDPAGWVRRMFLAPQPENAEGLEASDRTMRWVLDRIKEAGQRHGCRWVIIDPWNEIEHDWGKQYTETQYISRMLKLLKQACRRYTMAIVLIAHPKIASVEKAIDECDLNDVAGGMAWNAKADHGVILARHPTEQNVIYVKVSKSRDQRLMGVPGICQLRYNARHSTYEFVGKGI